VQRSHAPCGELNEKIRGSSSGIDVPHFRHANFSENVSTVPVPSRGRVSTSMIPSASATAVSTESARRLRTSPAHDEAVDHHRDVVLELLVEDGRVVEHPQLAVDLHARVAVRPQLLEELAVLALAPADHRRHDHEAARPRAAP
jgi:hypothetical protein